MLVLSLIRSRQTERPPTNSNDNSKPSRHGFLETCFSLAGMPRLGAGTLGTSVWAIRDHGVIESWKLVSRWHRYLSPGQEFMTVAGGHYDTMEMSSGRRALSLAHLDFDTSVFLISRWKDSGSSEIPRRLTSARRWRRRQVIPTYRKGRRFRRDTMTWNKYLQGTNSLEGNKTKVTVVWLVLHR
jgi:hypothetical protein